jgi:hypothetical protein
MNDIVIEQAILIRDRGSSRFLARSPGFLDDWQREAERLATQFGKRPAGVTCPAAVFAQPLGKQHVAIVQVADQGSDEAGRPAALGFHFLIVPKDAYVRMWGDPFPLAERATPIWHARGQLPALSWPAEPLPPRTVAEVRRVLQRTKGAALPEDEEIPPDWDRNDMVTPENSESPALLGGTQVLVDGGRLVFERPGPDTGLLSGLWTLLPTSTRNRLWPASFAFSNALGFDALVVPTGTRLDDSYAGYTNEDQACEYPQGYYELNLQIAAEVGNQADLDSLLRRRSWGETWRLGLTLLVVFTVLAVALNLIQSPRPDTDRKEAQRRARAATAAGVVGTGAHPWSAVGWLKADEHLREKPRLEAP